MSFPSVNENKTKHAEVAARAGGEEKKKQQIPAAIVKFTAS